LATSQAGETKHTCSRHSEKARSLHRFGLCQSLPRRAFAETYAGAGIPRWSELDGPQCAVRRGLSRGRDAVGLGCSSFSGLPILLRTNGADCRFDFRQLHAVEVLAPLEAFPGLGRGHIGDCLPVGVLHHIATRNLLNCPNWREAASLRQLLIGSQRATTHERLYL